jgi:hypothetical protein
VHVCVFALLCRLHVGVFSFSLTSDVYSFLLGCSFGSSSRYCQQQTGGDGGSARGTFRLPGDPGARRVPPSCYADCVGERVRKVVGISSK